MLSRQVDACDSRCLAVSAPQIGKINVNEFSNHLAVARALSANAQTALNDGEVSSKMMTARAVEG